MSEKVKILLVDDEPDILDFMEYNLVKEGYDVSTAQNGQEAISIADEIVPDLIVLDVMMPVMDGIEACDELKKNAKLSQTIITFLSARSEDYSQIAGLEAGADDYISKPIKPKVLVSKIKALLRRKPTLVDAEEDDNNMIKVDDIVIDRSEYLIKKGETVFSLPKKEFELLALLLSKPGKVFTRESIMDKVWGTDVVVGDRTIDVHIRKLREKITGEKIQTVKGVGYKYI
jgi:two-component system, OmpR family, alkaline phosphatase synthesis response regulator PhoP